MDIIFAFSPRRLGKAISPSVGVLSFFSRTDSAVNPNISHADLDGRSK